MGSENERPHIFTRALRGSLDFIVSTANLLEGHRTRESELHTIDDVPYRDTGSSDHRLDIIRLKGSTGVQPALLYIHGGGFAVCSKETHRYFAYQYAKLGFTVFNINYRLMPEHRFPAAPHDALHALRWVLDNASTYGADVSQLVIAGESAGGNLSLGVTVASKYDCIDDPLAAEIFERDPQIQAVLPACGLLQVSNCARLWRENDQVHWIGQRIFRALERDYLPLPSEGPGKPDLADPLCVVEARTPARALPPMFIYCGTKDYVYDDSARLARALKRHRTPFEFRSYERMDHAFHALPWEIMGRKCWEDQAEFLEGCMSNPLQPEGPFGYEAPIRGDHVAA